MRRSEKCLSEKPNHCSVEKHHFTLIELLIVVAIIAILASMLMPALNSAVKASRSISCVNLEKTLSLGFQLYAGNNNDYIPSCYYASRRYPGFSGDVATEGATWRAYIYLSVYPNSPLPATSRLISFTDYTLRGQQLQFHCKGPGTFRVFHEKIHF